MTSDADVNREIITKLSLPDHTQDGGAIALLSVQSSKEWSTGFHSFIICEKITKIVIQYQKTELLIPLNVSVSRRLLSTTTFMIHSSPPWLKKQPR